MPDAPNFDLEVSHFAQAIQAHQNINCEFQALPREEQLKLARALSQAHLKDVQFQYDSSRMDVTIVQSNVEHTTQCAVKEQPHPLAPAGDDAVDVEVNRQYRRILEEERPTIDAQRQAEYAKQHDPDRIAKAIEETAKRDLAGDQGAKLELRKLLEGLGHESPEVQGKVVKELQADGSKYNPFNPVPEATVTYGPNGQPQEITFSKFWSHDGNDNGSLSKSIEEQAKEAEERYYTKTVPNAGVFGSGAVAQHEQEKRDGTLPEDKKFWWEKVLPPDR